MYRSRSPDRDGGDYRRRSPRRRDDRDGEHYRSRKEDSSRTPPRSPLSRPGEDMYRGRARHGNSRDNGRHGDSFGAGRPPHPPGQAAGGLRYDDPPIQAVSPGVAGGGPGRARHDRDQRGRSSRSRSSSRHGAAGWPSEPGAPRRRSRSPGGREYNGRGRGGGSRTRSRGGGGDYRRDSSRGGSHERSRENSPDRYRNYRERPRPHRREPTSQTLILENLPYEVSEKDILLGMDHASGNPRMSTDQVRFVRIRNNKRGGKIAFVEFWGLSDATDFFDRFYPTVSFPLIKSRGIDSEPIPVGLNYSRPREDMGRHDPRGDDGAWNCLECGISNYPHRAACYKCKVERPDDWTMGGYGGYDAHPSGGFILTGETDQCPQQAPSQFIVIRDLEPSVTEEVLAKGVAKLFLDNERPPPKEPKPTSNKLKSTAPTNSTVGLGAAPGSLRRVFLIRDRRSNESWRYGFAEFATVEDARAAVAKFRASAKFTIASKPVMVAFIHSGVFVPAFDAPSLESPEFTFAPIYNPDLRVKYWDDRAYPSTLVVSSGPDPSSSNLPGSSGDADKNPASSGGKGGPASQDASGKKAKKDKDALASKKALAMAPQMQMWAKKAAELHGTPKERRDDGLGNSLTGGPASASGPSDQKVPGSGPSLDAPDSTNPVHPHPRDQYVSFADWDNLECLLCGKFRTDEGLIHHEVSTHDCFKDEAVKAQAAKLLADRGKEPRNIIRRVPRLKRDPLPVYTSYADQDKLTCYICKREFTCVNTFRYHERESELHKRNLAIPGRIEEAVAELAKEGWTPAKMHPLGYHGPVRPQPTTQGSQYRDRALERRTVYNQPSKPAAQPAKGGGAGAGGNEEPVAAAPAAQPPKESKGAGLLAKMGWAAGSGLGAQGAGRTEALSTELYAPRVGLGAEGGRLGDAAEEAVRKTRNDFGDFVAKTKDKARERFERLG